MMPARAIKASHGPSAYRAPVVSLLSPAVTDRGGRISWMLATPASWNVALIAICASGAMKMLKIKLTLKLKAENMNFHDFF